MMKLNCKISLSTCFLCLFFDVQCTSTFSFDFQNQISVYFSSVLDRVLNSQSKGPGFDYGPGGHCADWIWVYYSCGSAASFRWDVKPRSGLRAHAFKNMRGPERTRMTKRKSRGPVHTDMAYT